MLLHMTCFSPFKSQVLAIIFVGAFTPFKIFATHSLYEAFKVVGVFPSQICCFDIMHALVNPPSLSCNDLESLNT
jgi:hypothetical protein